MSKGAGAGQRLIRPETKTRGVSGGRKRSSAANTLSLCASKHHAIARADPVALLVAHGHVVEGEI